MTDNSSNAVARAYEKLRETLDNTPFSPNTNDAHINALRADADALKQELENDGRFAFKEQRSNGSHDKDEPVEHTDEYKDRSNDWLGYAKGGQLTRTVNAEKADEQKAREEKAEREDERQDKLAQGQDRDGVSNGPDQRKTR